MDWVDTACHCWVCVTDRQLRLIEEFTEEELMKKEVYERGDSSGNTRSSSSLST